MRAGGGDGKARRSHQAAEEGYVSIASTSVERARAPREPKAATAKHAGATEPPKRLTPARGALESSARTAQDDGGAGQARRSCRAAEATHTANTDSIGVEQRARAS